MKKIKYVLPAQEKVHKSLFSQLIFSLKIRLLPIFYCMAASLRGVPGISLHFRIIWLGVRLLFSKKIASNIAKEIMNYPIDSVRYFEFDFVWRALTSYESIGQYLDISSPRMLSIALLDKYGEIKADIVNPDTSDLQATISIVRAFDFEQRCVFHNKLVEELNFEETFDTAVSISVLEHIPGQSDHLAVKKIWKMLKPGGRLLVTVPCCNEAFEEYYNINQYGLLHTEEDMYFGQRFYDEALLEERFFSVTGKPVKYSVYGEKKLGLYDVLRHSKLSQPSYPIWQEPYIMGQIFTYFNSISEMPGIGVIAMEFIKVN